MIGLIPCAGSAVRIHGIPKYLLPLPQGYLLDILIKRMKAVGAKPVIGANQFNSGLVKEYAKEESVYIPDHYNTMTQTVIGYRQHMDINEPVLFGMPDTYIEDDDCFPKLLAALDDGAHVAVALFLPRPNQHMKAGMCTIHGNQVQESIDKPANKLHYTHVWGALAWKAEFWDLLQPEYPHVGYALPQAIKKGLDVRAVKMDGGYYDCGTFDEYTELVTHLRSRKNAKEMMAIYA